jgi:hypothetical protein
LHWAIFRKTALIAVEQQNKDCWRKKASGLNGFIIARIIRGFDFTVVWN